MSIVFFLQGDVYIRDGHLNSDHIQVDIEKYAPTEQSLANIITHKAGFDIGRGTVYVLQLVSPLLFLIL